MTKLILGNHQERLSNCLYCGSDNIRVLYGARDLITNMQGIFYVSRCDNCSLSFQNPRVKEENHNLINIPYVEVQCVSNQEDKLKQSWIRDFKRYLRRQTMINHFGYKNLGRGNALLKLITFTFKTILKVEMVPERVKNGKLLEIGCAAGERLSALRGWGWDVCGVEMDERLAEHAGRKYNLKIQKKKVEEAVFNESDFDVITMAMVLEHLYSPFEILKKLTEILKSGGQLIFSIPYFDGLEFKIFKQYSYGLQLPHHMFFLNKKIIREYLAELGYKNIKFYFQYADRDIVASAEYKYLDTGSLFYRFLARNAFLRKFIIKPIVFILSFMQKTSRLSVYAEKI